MGTYDIAFIGGGPGGYVGAIRAAQLGLKVALFERDRVGGVCLNRGCIPSKALLKNADVVELVRKAGDWGIEVSDAAFDMGAAIDRSRQVVDRIVAGVEGLLRDNGIDVITGTASLKDSTTVECNGESHAATNIVLGTGASARMLPGVHADGQVVITSREALEMRRTPGRAVIIGAGPVGVEFAHFWASYGAQITLVEMLDTLMPQEDPDIGRALGRSFTNRGMRCLPKTRVESVEVKDGVARVAISGGKGSETIESDTVLVAIGFVPNTHDLNLEAAGVATERGFIAIDDQMRTSVPNIYAIGDVTGKLMLAHVASHQGMLAAETIAGNRVPAIDYLQMPRGSFCQPQIGSLGYTEAQAKAAGFDVKVGRFPLTALGRAIAIGDTEGFVKVVADKETGQMLGIHMIGHDINELLGEAALGALLEATTVDIGFAVHVHPSLGEALKEAALAADGEAIHISYRRASR
jgi:dihydrolipoamide dehydrogenase